MHSYGIYKNKSGQKFCNEYRNNEIIRGLSPNTNKISKNNNKSDKPHISEVAAKGVFYTGLFSFETLSQLLKGVSKRKKW